MSKKTAEKNQPQQGSHASEEVADQDAREQDSPDAQDNAPDKQREDGASEWEEQINQLEQELAETNERLLRQAAELQNFRRRAEEEKTRLIASSKTRVIRPILEVLDDLERSLEATEKLDESGDVESAYESLREGVELVNKKFQTALDQLGVEAIEAEGEPFDENKHEAMMQQPADDDVEPGVVLQEIQKGYRMGDRVLRHSKVVVAADE